MSMLGRHIQMMGGAGEASPNNANALLYLDDNQASISDVPRPSANRGAITVGTKLEFLGSAGKFGANALRILCNGGDINSFQAAIPGSADIRTQLGTGDFTFSTWAMRGASYGSAGDWYLLRAVNAGGTPLFQLRVNDDAIMVTPGFTAGSGAPFSSASTFKHIAIARKSGTIAMWYDGSRQFSSADSTDWNDVTSIRLGSSAGTNRGYINIDDWCLLKTAIYDPANTTITVPTTAFGIT